MERMCRTSWPAIVASFAIFVLFAMAGPASSAKAGQFAGDSKTVEFESGGATYRYILYTPASYSPRKPAPLVVAAHGCMTTAEQFQSATLYNRLADRKGFLVAYVDVDPATAALPQPLKNCWHFYKAETWHRGQGQAAAVAGMTRAVMDSRRINPQRVYMAGTSAGGFMTAAMAAAYPDLFAAVAIVAGGGYDDGFCFGPSPGLTPVGEMAARARAEMGARARVVPRMVMGGDADQGISPACADKSFFQGLRTNNLVLGTSQTSPIPLEPASTRIEPKPGGYDTTVSSYKDPYGCLVAERWLIHDMNHFWPGGSSDPAWSNWTDPKGPSGARATWAFFKRYTKTSTAMPCAERKPRKHAKPRCVRRKAKLWLPKRVRRVRVTVNGRKAGSRILKRRVKVWFPAGNRKRTVVVIKAKKRSGKVVRRRVVFRGCGPGRR